MIPSLVLTVFVSNAAAVTRQEVLDLAGEMAGHPWTMGAPNESAACADSYASDYEAGAQTVGVPYAWGGFDEPQTFDQRIAAGEGAGSHSWHGVLSCVTGLDCSGFVSRAWGLSAKLSTSSMSSVSHSVSIDDLKPGDAFNKAGSHIVLLIAWTEEGEPVFQEASGAASKVRTHEGWSYLSGYAPIRYNSIEDAPLAGSSDRPIPVTVGGFEDARMPLGPAERGRPLVACADEPAAPGTGQLLFAVEITETATLGATSEGALVRVLDADMRCQAAALDGVEAALTAGRWLVAVTGPQGRTLSSKVEVSAAEAPPETPTPAAGRSAGSCVTAPGEGPPTVPLFLLFVTALGRRRASSLARRS